jgi:hypothetical protein
MSIFNSILSEVYASGLRRLSELFNLCVNTCEKSAGSRYWECVDMCHRHFNIAITYSVETV